MARWATRSQLGTMKPLFTLAVLSVSAPAFGQGQIFRPDRSFVYAVAYVTADATVLDTLRITCTGRPWKADPDKQVELVIHYDLERLDTALFAGQASIGWVHTDTTGAVDNDRACWFHPPRHNQYRMLELAPFPRVEYPLEVDRRYSRALFIGAGWGDLSNTKVLWHYRITGRTGDRWTIAAEAVPEDEPGKSSQLEFTFSSEAGFMDLHYTLHDGTRISMTRVPEMH